MTTLVAKNRLRRCAAGVFSNGMRDSSITYSDGEDSEEYLRGVLTHAKDLSSSSVELASKIKDWPSEYHLSPKRANLLRALNLTGIERALELGCGCGAITRFLGERGLAVEAVEGSRVRAELAALRCRDLDNINIVTANFNNLTLPEQAYDAIFLIGVIEYAKRFSDSAADDEEAVIALLTLARQALASDGILCIAIENRTGLKYSLGAHEDHHGKRYIGIHNYHPDSSGMRTYTKLEWERILEKAGMQHVEFLLPFPDYKLPTVVLAERYAKTSQYAYCHLDTIRSRDYVGPLDLEQPEPLLWEALCHSGTLVDHANAFLIVVSENKRRIAEVCDADFVHLPEFKRPASLSCVVRKKRNTNDVERVRIEDVQPESPDYDLGDIVHRVGTEPFYPGVLLSIEWARSLLIQDAVEGFEQYLRDYYTFLYEYRSSQPLPIDLLPANIVVRSSGRYAVFDQEWQMASGADVDFVFFRAIIWFALRYHLRQALEVLTKRRRIKDVRGLVIYAFNTVGRAVEEKALDRYLELEQDFQTLIKGSQSDRISLDVPLIGERRFGAPISRIYWKCGGDTVYSERNCRTLEVSVSRERQTLTYDLPRDANSMTHFRFDPREAQGPPDFGFMHIHGMHVFACGAQRECVWKIESAESVAAQGKMSGLSFHHASLGAVFAITDEDPWLEFAFTPRRLPRPDEHYRVTVDLTPSRSADYILARDRYLVREEIMSQRMRYLEEQLARHQNVEQELRILKSSKAWRLAELYRRSIHNRVQPRVQRAKLWFAAAQRYGFAGTLRRVYMRLRSGDREQERQRLAQRTPYEVWLDQRSSPPPKVANGPLISILMPVYNVAPELLQRAVDSVQRQSYGNWELCIVDDCSTRRGTRAFLRTLNAPNIKIEFLSENLNIAGASNRALALASGDYIALLDNDDELTNHALAWVARCAVHSAADLIYSDEDFIRPDGHFDFPHLKPDYSPDLLLSHNYITHLLVLKRSLMRAIGGFRSGYDGAQDYDLVLRAVERANAIEHVAQPLYHWRMTPGSTSLDPTAKPHAHENGKRALQDALSRRGIAGAVLDANLPHFFRVKRELVNQPLVSIVIPFKDKPGLLKQCLDSILERSTYQRYEIVGISNNTVTPTTFDLMTDYQQRERRIRFIESNMPFNFSTLANTGVEHAQGDHIVLCNNDIEIITPEWIEGLLEHSQREEVAVVGGKLYFPNNTIQHAGIGIGLGGYAGHFHKNFPAHANGYFNRLNIVQNVSALTAALFMVKQNVYAELGGFDEEFMVAYNDVDFCLRARERGWLNVLTPYVEAYHHESISRGYEDTAEKLARFETEKQYLQDRYGALIARGDPYYNVNFDQGRDDFAIRGV